MLFCDPYHKSPEGGQSGYCGELDGCWCGREYWEGEVGSAYNIGQTRTQPKSGMEIKKHALELIIHWGPVGRVEMRARGTLKVLQLIHPIRKRNGTDRASVPSTSFFCGF